MSITPFNFTVLWDRIGLIYSTKKTMVGNNALNVPCTLDFSAEYVQQLEYSNVFLRQQVFGPGLIVPRPACLHNPYYKEWTCVFHHLMPKWQPSLPHTPLCSRHDTKVTPGRSTKNRQAFSAEDVTVPTHPAYRPRWFQVNRERLQPCSRHGSADYNNCCCVNKVKQC